MPKMHPTQKPKFNYNPWQNIFLCKYQSDHGLTKETPRKNRPNWKHIARWSGMGLTQLAKVLITLHSPKGAFTLLNDWISLDIKPAMLTNGWLSDLQGSLVTIIMVSNPSNKQVCLQVPPGGFHHDNSVHNLCFQGSQIISMWIVNFHGFSGKSMHPTKQAMIYYDYNVQ